MEKEETTTYGIVGAGFYGLRIAKTLLDVNPKANIQILDANSSIGGTWCKSRLYPNLRIQSVREHVEFSEFPMMPEDTIDGTYISGRQIYDYLDRFAKLYGLYERIRLNTKVVNIQRADTSIGTGNGGRVLDVETLENGNVMDIHPQGESEIKQSIATRITFDKLIMATGLCGRPYLPPFPTQDLRADIIHAQELGENYQQLDSSTITSVTIIGGGKSAFDAVYLALQKGKRVDWVIPKDGTGPTALYPLHLMNVPLLNSIKLSVTRFVTSLSPCVTTLEMKNGLTWWGRFLHTSILGRFIVSLIFRLLTWMCAWDAGFTKSENSAKLRPNVDSVFWCDAGLGLTTLPDFWDLFHKSPVTVHRADIQLLSDRTVELNNGVKFPTDLIIACTGYYDDIPVFDRNEWGKLGLPHNPETDVEISLESEWLQLEAEADLQITAMFPTLKQTPQQVIYQTGAQSETPKKIPLRFTIRTQRSVAPYRQFRRMVPPEFPDRSIIIIGHIHTMNTPVIAEVSSLWGVAYLLGTIQLPEKLEMKQEIARWCAWTRRRYSRQGEKTGYAMYDTLHYTDLLLHDLGVNYYRKSNYFQEVTDSYKPRDFKGCTAEWMSTAGL